ncbi:hypothetical protein FLACOL_01903 [Flavobacterium columnare]|uniref:Uncharacterized protein n=2 Tax=Flavobacterium TaxID=237 RepID=A0ABW8PND4_9FLAO|nr:hypothetical protein [Flavobacterium columnare]SPE77893.1 hypothetical protein FLACOL_01903 [Flavobacterium columnare]
MVINRTTGYWVCTNPMGEFEIVSCLEDILVITSPNIEPLQIQLNVSSFKTDVLLLRFFKNKRIREVYIKRFTVLSRGRVNKNTALEYKVKESKENFYDLNSKWPLEGILNTFSGKTKMVGKY